MPWGNMSMTTKISGRAMIVCMADYFKVVYSRELSSEYEPRYIVIQPKTGAVLDDAQGFGYTSREKAAKAYTYKKMPHPEQRSLAARKRRVEKWCLEHLDVVDGYADICLQHMKASGDGRISMSSAVVSRYLKDCGYDNLPFSAQDFIRYCKT